MTLCCKAIAVFLLFYIGNRRNAKATSCQTRFLSTASSGQPCATCSASFHLFAPTSRPTDNRYDDLRRHSNNMRHRSDAGYITLPRNADQVVQILRHAMANNIRPTVRSGGHCYEDFWANNTGGVLIDLQAMNRIYQSPNDSTIWMEPGVKLDQAYDELYKEHGLALPGGVCLDVAMGGHVLGGGYGYLARKFGLISDFVDFIEIVHVNASRSVELILVGRNSTNEKERNLYWGLRGGGQQNFGVVTKYGFRNLPPSPPIVYKYDANFTLNIDIDEARFHKFLDEYTQFWAAHSALGDEYCDVMTDLLVGRKLNSSYLWLRIILIGENVHLVDRFLATMGLNAQNFTCQKMSYYRLTRVAGYANDITTDGDYFVRRSAYMVGPMPLRQRDALWRYMTDPIYSYVVDANVQIRPYGCAVSSVPESDTAYAHRTAVIKMQYQIVWQNSEDTSSQMRWTRDLYGAVYGQFGPRPDGVMDGCYVSYPDGELVNGQQLYYKGNYERLKQVKGQWDPLNIFHHRQSIELPENLMKRSK